MWILKRCIDRWSYGMRLLEANRQGRMDDAVDREVRRTLFWFRFWRDVDPMLRPFKSVYRLSRLAWEVIDGRYRKSAKKVHGRPAYELARNNVEFELQPADVELFEFRLTEIEGSVARFTIECSSGTYVRSLAHDMGKKLGCGAHLTEICRTAVGEFSIEQAIAIEELAAAAREGKLKARIIPLENLLANYPRANVLPVLEKRVRHGGKFKVMT